MWTWFSFVFAVANFTAFAINGNTEHLVAGFFLLAILPFTLDL